MLRRSLFISILLCVVAAGVAGADVLIPDIFRTSKSGRTSAAAFGIVTYFNDSRFDDSMALSIVAKAPGKYSYALLDTADDSILQAGEGSLDEVHDGDFEFFPDREIKLDVDIPVRGRSTRYKVIARYVPYSSEWQSVSFTEYFTLRSSGGRIIIE